MKSILLIILVTLSPLSYSKEPDPGCKRGQVLKIVMPRPWMELKGKMFVYVWDGKKAVQVIIPSQYVRKITLGSGFPYKITVDPKTGKYVSQGKPIF